MSDKTSQTDRGRLFNPFTERTAGEYFVGREEQLRRYEVSLEGLAEGQPSHMFVAGQHGTGKSSYLDRLAAMANERSFIGVMTTLDEPRHPGQHVLTAIRALVAGLERRSEERGRRVALLNDWDRGEASELFRQCRSEDLRSDYIRDDLARLTTTARELGFSGYVLCLDEAQRLHPTALSALKNGLQDAADILVVLSLRLPTAEGGALRAGRALLDQKATEAEGDIGASRLFVTEVAMGPFDSDDEAQVCINRRLLDHAIQFEDGLTRQIARLAGRVPHAIIHHAGAVYDQAVDDECRRATESHLEQAIRYEYSVQLGEATAMVGDLSSVARRAIGALLDCGGTATAERVAERLYPGVVNEAADKVRRGVAADLDAFVARVAYCEKTEETYRVTDSLQQYLLRLALLDS